MGAPPQGGRGVEPGARASESAAHAHADVDDQDDTHTTSTTRHTTSTKPGQAAQRHVTLDVVPASSLHRTA
jgi:hypothetical protein